MNDDEKTAAFETLLKLKNGPPVKLPWPKEATITEEEYERLIALEAKIMEAANRHTMTGKQRRFLLFAGDSYYPSGGWNDFIGYFPSVEAAKEGALRLGIDSVYIYNFEWAHIVNGLTDEIELEGSRLISGVRKGVNTYAWKWDKPKGSDEK